MFLCAKHTCRRLAASRQAFTPSASRHLELRLGKPARSGATLEGPPRREAFPAKSEFRAFRVKAALSAMDRGAARHEVLADELMDQGLVHHQPQPGTGSLKAFKSHPLESHDLVVHLNAPSRSHWSTIRATPASPMIGRGGTILPAAAGRLPVRI